MGWDCREHQKIYLERENSPVMLTKIQFEILNSIFFAERFESIVEELTHPVPVIRDELRGLIRKRMVIVLEERAGEYHPLSVFDSSSPENYAFRASNKGIEAFEKRDKEIRNK